MRHVVPEPETTAMELITPVRVSVTLVLLVENMYEPCWGSGSNSVGRLPYTITFTSPFVKLSLENETAERWPVEPKSYTETFVEPAPFSFTIETLIVSL